MLSIAEASLGTFNPFDCITAISLCHAFLLRCNVSVVLFGKGIACIAIHLALAIELQMFSPYGAGSVNRCSLFVNRCS